MRFLALTTRPWAVIFRGSYAHFAMPSMMAQRFKTSMATAMTWASFSMKPQSGWTMPTRSGCLTN